MALDSLLDQTMRRLIDRMNLTRICLVPASDSSILKIADYFESSKQARDVEGVSKCVIEDVGCKLIPLAGITRCNVSVCQNWGICS